MATSATDGLPSILFVMVVHRRIFV
jgi:hypothetical protein